MTTQEIQQITEAVIFCKKAVLSCSEAARYMNISKSTLYKMMMRRQVPYSKPNGKVAFFDREELEKWLMGNRIATADEINSQAQSYCMRNKPCKKAL